MKQPQPQKYAKWDAGLKATAPISWDYEIIPRPEIWPSKADVFLSLCRLMLVFVNPTRQALGLAEIDIHGREIAGTEPPSVKVFGSMLAAIAREKEERLGQLWLLMRAADTAGSGWLHRDIVYGLWQTSPANMRKIIRQGENAGYWRLNGDYIGYVSEARLCAILGITAVSGYAVSIPISQLKEKNIVRLRALFLDSFHSGRGENANPIARGSWKNHHETTIKAKTGRSRPSQRRYERARGLTVKSNFEDLGQYSQEALNTIRRGEPGQVGQPAFVLRLPGQTARIVKRLSNTYCGTLKTAKRSRKRLNGRINKLEVGRVQLQPPASDATADDTPINCKRYYSSTEKAQSTKADNPGVSTLYGYIKPVKPGGLWLPA